MGETTDPVWSNVQCPKGCGTVVVGRAYAPRPEAYDPARVNLVCCACGDGFCGTPEQVTACERADDAYEARMASEIGAVPW